MELVFRSDTKQRKSWFTGVSFSHPAKMMLPLELWLIENYTKPGDIILDPMAGSGTVLVACSMGRHVIAVELEAKFIEIIKGNWQKIQERGPMLGCTMGTAQIIQGDARNLEGLLVDKCVFSPPYAEAQSGGGLAKGLYTGKKGHSPNSMIGERTYTPETHGQSEGQIGNLPYGKLDAVITSPPFGGAEAADARKTINDTHFHTGQGADKLQHYEKDNIANLSYGSIDSIITSPPYEGSDVSQTHMTSDKRGDPANPNYRPSWKRKLEEGYADTKRPYHQVDSIITSPPYENQVHDSLEERLPTDIAFKKARLPVGYGGNNNIGNLKSTSYLEAMLAVYRSCFAVLKAGGLLCLVTKDFIRNQKRVDLAGDTIKLCETAGFTFKERHYRKLTQVSFWRTIYAQRYPAAPVLDTEDILIFTK